MLLSQALTSRDSSAFPSFLLPPPKGNMLAAVAPFALESGLVPIAKPPLQRLEIRSLVTGARFSADVRLALGAGAGKDGEEDGEPFVQYVGEHEVAGIPGTAAPVVLTTHGITGMTTGDLLPTGAPLDTFDAGNGLEGVHATVVDFARVLVVVDAAGLLSALGHQGGLEGLTKEAADQNEGLNRALECVRLAAAERAGMGDCSSRDSPKVCLVARAGAEYSAGEGDAASSGNSSIVCRYWVNPGRCEMHTAIAMTASQVRHCTACPTHARFTKLI